MNKLGYIHDSSDVDTTNSYIDSFKKDGCTNYFIEPNNGSPREEWKNFIENLKPGDCAYFVSFKNAFPSLNDFIIFAKFCDKKKISIISIEDGITPSSQISELLKAISTLSNSKTDSDTEIEINSKKIRILKKQMRIINMYRSGFSIEEIMNINGFKSKTSIYNIFSLYGIPKEYPEMARKK